MRATFTCATAAVLSSLVLAFTVPAQAACKRFGFTVNDYGKEGPTKDAKDLLDKHIADWATQNSIVEYQTGKKDVSCELFLDLGLFDEHTCTASANVCWGQGSGGSSAEQADSDTPPTPVRKAAQQEPAGAEQQATSDKAGSDANVPAKPEAPVTAAASADATPDPATEENKGSAETANAAAIPFKKAASDTATPPAKAALEAMTAAKRAQVAPVAEKAPDPVRPGALVETGALPDDKAAVPVVRADPLASKVAPKPKAKPATAAVDDRLAAAAAAAAAAERAAAAAERAAAAAKEAAAAAKEATAAALAVRDASQEPMVPALEPAPDAKQPARASAKRPQ